MCPYVLSPKKQNNKTHSSNTNIAKRRVHACLLVGATSPQFFVGIVQCRLTGVFVFVLRINSIIYDGRMLPPKQKAQNVG